MAHFVGEASGYPTLKGNVSESGEVERGSEGLEGLEPDFGYAPLNGCSLEERVVGGDRGHCADSRLRASHVPDVGDDVDAQAIQEHVAADREATGGRVARLAAVSGSSNLAEASDLDVLEKDAKFVPSSQIGEVRLRLQGVHPELLRELGNLPLEHLVHEDVGVVHCRAMGGWKDAGRKRALFVAAPRGAICA